MQFARYTDESSWGGDRINLGWIMYQVDLDGRYRVSVYTQSTVAISSPAALCYPSSVVQSMFDSTTTTYIVWSSVRMVS